MLDCHIHSFFSGDSEMSAEAACKAAMELGLKGLTFTDHLDYDFPKYHDMDSIDFKIYMEFMDMLKDRFYPQFSILKGIEIGIQPHVIEKSLQLVQSHEFDYVLASVHIINGLDPYRLRYFDDLDKKESYDRYLQAILFMIRNFHDFDNVGHLEFIIRCAPYADRTLMYADHQDVLDQIFKELIHKGKGIEINTAAFRDAPGKVTAIYDSTVLKRYLELGGQIITLGSDAHDTGYIGYKFDYFQEILKEVGFRYIAHFENRKPVFLSLLN